MDTFNLLYSFAFNYFTWKKMESHLCSFPRQHEHLILYLYFNITRDSTLRNSYWSVLFYVVLSFGHIGTLYIYTNTYTHAHTHAHVYK